jgi:hypothetical protein
MEERRGNLHVIRGDIHGLYSAVFDFFRGSADFNFMETQASPAPPLPWSCEEIYMSVFRSSVCPSLSPLACPSLSPLACPSLSPLACPSLSPL